VAVLNGQWRRDSLSLDSLCLCIPNSFHNSGARHAFTDLSTFADRVDRKMGNCCGGGEESEPLTSNATVVQKKNAFQGTGHRLGSADEHRATSPSIAATNRESDLPEPIINPNLTDAEREKLRSERAAAAEARMKKQGLNPKQKKKPSTKGEPLRGPNSEPLMRWNAAG